MRDLFLLLILTSYAGLGLIAPFTAGLGYIWVDFLAPQRLGFGFLASVPVAMIMAAWTFLVYFVLDRRNAPRASAPSSCWRCSAHG